MSEEKAKRSVGRPKLDNPADSKARGIHQIRAYEDEWAVIKRFMKLTRADLAACEKAVELLELKTDKK